MFSSRALSRALIGAALAASFISTARAQSPGPITLSEALTRAEAQAPAIAEAKAAVDAARGRTRQAGLGPNPEARLEVENFSGSGLYSGLDFAETTLSFSQTIELGGKRRSRIAAGQAEGVAAETRLAIARADLNVTVRRLFAAALAAREQVALATAARDRAQDLARVAQTLVDVGREPPLRSLRAKAAAAEAEAELSRVKAEDNAARSALAAVLGDTVLPSQVVGTFESLPGSPKLIDPTETLDVRLAEAEAEAARAAVLRERSVAATDLTVELGARQFEDSRDTAVVFGVSAPIPIFNGNQGNIEAASAEVRGANARRLQALANSVQRMRESDGLLVAAQARVTTLETAAVPAAAEALSLARAGFEAGRFTLLDVLDAENAFASAQSALIDAQRDRADAAAALARAIAN
ncbi:MAG: TolC family protein [Alphaproteobacteria bacterium]|nr:TolC family protein [Alphaproteobacteria bacterium]